MQIAAMKKTNETFCQICDESTDFINGRVFSCCQAAIHNICYIRSLGAAETGRCICCRTSVELSDEEKAVEMLQRNVVQKEVRLEADRVELVRLLRTPEGRENPTLTEFLNHFFEALKARTDDSLLERWALWEECLSQVANPASYAVQRTNEYYQRELIAWLQGHEQQLSYLLGIKPTSTISLDILRDSLAILENSTFSPTVKALAWELFFGQYQCTENGSVLTEFIETNLGRVLRLADEGVIVQPEREQLPEISNQELQAALNQLEQLNLTTEEKAEAWRLTLESYPKNPQNKLVIDRFLVANSNRLQRLLFEPGLARPVEVLRVPAQLPARQSLYIAVAVIALFMAYFFSTLNK